MRTREQLLELLVELSASGRDSHTDAVNGLEALLYDEAAKEPRALWVAKWRELPEPR